MAIPITRYVNITSGIGAGATVPNRELILRIFTTNPLVPPQTFQEYTFDQLSAIGNLFGTSSEEYLRAVFYFGWISKNITRPQKISYARWVNVATPPLIFGAILGQTPSEFSSISNGSFTLTIGSQSNLLSGLNFTSIVTLSDVAAVIQAAINAQSGTQWTAATVVWDSLRGSFNFTGGVAGAATISVTEGSTGTPIAHLIGWLASQGAIFSNGSAVETITQTLTNSFNQSNNFGSFLFTNGAGLNLSQIVEAATWADGLNITVMYWVPVTFSNATSYFNALQNFGGTGVTISETINEFPEQAPGMILAATDYTAVDSVQNYEFQQFNLTPSVSDSTTANTLDSENINYYGVTQQAGTLIAFYQTGVLMGETTDPSDMNVFANEIWFKDAAEVALMSLFLALPKISANRQGQSQITSALQAVIDVALNNGTISVGKILTTQQQLYITEITQDPDAWYQVQSVGYWLNVAIVPFVAKNNATQYKAVYTLVYSKNDDVRMIDGTHVLI